jgi:hypothetical protein
MSLSIQLDPPQHGIFASGDIVSGNVVLTSKKSYDISSVTITFQGKARTTVGQGTYFYNKYLFEYEETLFQGPYTLPASTHSWPFEFRFPERPQEVEKNQLFGNTGLFRDGNPFNDSDVFVLEPDELPPTCFNKEKYGTCKVTYKVYAAVTRPYWGWTEKTALNFSPMRREERPEISMARSGVHLFHEFRIGGDGVPRALSNTEKIRDVFRSKSDTQTIDFMLEVKAPKSIVIGESFPVLICVCSESTAAAIPTFYLQAMHATLGATTKIRAHGSGGDHFWTFNESVSLEVNEQIVRNLPLNEAVALDGVMVGVEKTTPSFASFSIARSYVLTISVEVRCLEEVFKAFMKVNDLKVLSSRFRGVEKGVRRDSEKSKGNKESGGGNEKVLPWEANAKSKEK